MTEIDFKDGNVSFKEDEYIWNAYGKENIDHENVLTDEQWREFVRRYGKMDPLSIDPDVIGEAFAEFCEESK